MHNVDKLSRKLIRILNVETCEHPMLGEAIAELRADIENLEWVTADVPSRDNSDALAEAIEDKVGAKGHHLPLGALKNWKADVFYALRRAGLECYREANPHI
jgi:hypothetical protein